MDPTIPTHEKPVMDRRTYSWHLTVAGLRAAKAAEQQGCLPEAQAALLLSAADPARGFPRISLATCWAFEAALELPEDLVPDRFAEEAFFLLTLLDPERVLLSCLALDLLDLRRGMLEMATAHTPETFLRFKGHYDAEMDRLTVLTGGADETPEKKPHAVRTISKNPGAVPPDGSWV